MKKSLGVNAILNIIKTTMGMLFPLITFPYISRTLLVENVGKVNYAISIMTYFSLIAALGIHIYAVREGSRLRGNKEALNKFVSEVYSINVLTSLFAYGLLTVLILFTDIFDGYHKLLWVLSLAIPLSLIGADWINSIFEDYLYITIRTIAFQIIALLMIFILVKDRNDYVLYSLCVVVSSAGAGVINYFYTKRYSSRVFIFNCNFKKHIVPILILFFTSVASTLYSTADITMLGVMINDYSVGIYSTASKIYTIFKQLLFAIVIVCLPRFSYMYMHETKEKYEKMTNDVYNIIIILAVPLMAGMFTLSTNIVNILAGPHYSDAILTLKIKCIAIFFAIIAYFFMQLVLLPANKESLILKATLLAASTNIIANFFFIPSLQENGAGITTVLSELMVCAIVVYYSRKIINIKNNYKSIWQTIVSTVFLILFLKILNYYIDSDVYVLIFSLLGGLIIYFISLLIFRNVYAIRCIQIIKYKFRSTTVIKKN
ncbi:flippase [Paenibacillus sp. PL2-23]|uniref:flippase n=1 Tax=Paenibacillus sp. PL2-23 TaxID=2100729 RepID=UPI0030F8E748